MPDTVEKGGVLHTQWTLYDPASGPPLVLIDPDEFPTGPRFAVFSTDDLSNPLDGFSELTYSARLAPGIYNFDLPIPYADDIVPAGTYVIQLDLASVGGNALTSLDGSPLPSVAFTVVDALQDTPFTSDRLYVTQEELAQNYGIPDAELHEVHFAQQLINDWMHRDSLWPMVIEQERHDLPSDRSLVQLDVTPVIRLFNMKVGSPENTADLVGRLGYGRRDRRSLNQIGRDWLSSLALISSPPAYQPIDTARCNIHNSSGHVWLPVNSALAYYTEIQATYEAGYRVIQKRHKWAVAETLLFVRMRGAGPISRWSIGRAALSFNKDAYSDGLITEEVARRLDTDRVIRYR